MGFEVDAAEAALTATGACVGACMGACACVLACMRVWHIPLHMVSRMVVAWLGAPCWVFSKLQGFELLGCVTGGRNVVSQTPARYVFLVAFEPRKQQWAGFWDTTHPCVLLRITTNPIEKKGNKKGFFAVHVSTACSSRRALLVAILLNGIGW